MDSNLVEREMADKECVCKSGATLDVLGQVHRAYEERMEQIERTGGAGKLQMQVRVLRSWVSDLMAQNTLLVRAVEQLEGETAARMLERRRHAEHSGNIGRDNKMLELSVVNEALKADMAAKDREIRKLNTDLQQYEQAMARMREEMNPNVLKKDAEVMAGMCCTGTECGDLVPVQDIGEFLQEETSKYRERIQKMETSLKSSGMKMRAVHKINLGLVEEISTLRRFCVAVDVERRDARLKLDLEGQIVKQLVRQLRQAKAKLRQRETNNPASSETDFVSGDHDFRQPTSSNASMPIACTRQPRARRRDVPPPMDREPLDSSGDFRPFDGDRNAVLSRKSN